MKSKQAMACGGASWLGRGPARLIDGKQEQTKRQQDKAAHHRIRGSRMRAGVQLSCSCM